jgi:hypothetical protein
MFYMRIDVYIHGMQQDSSGTLSSGKCALKSQSGGLKGRCSSQLALRFLLVFLSTSFVIVVCICGIISLSKKKDKNISSMMLYTLERDSYIFLFLKFESEILRRIKTKKALPIFQSSLFFRLSA